MRPSALRAGSFSHYPEQARAVAAENLPLLERVPVLLLPLILRQLIEYDWLFPAEQSGLTRELHWLGGLAPADFDKLMAPFAAIQLPDELTGIDWLNEPRNFTAQLTAFLWSHHKIDDYHRAVHEYDQRREAAIAARPPATARYTFVLAGNDVKATDHTVFRRLRPHGTLFTALDPADGLQTLLAAVSKRAESTPGPFAHWYIDGGEPEALAGAVAGMTLISYAGLAPAVRKELAFLNREVTQRAQQNASGDAVQGTQQAASNVEGTVFAMGGLKPKDLGLDSRDVMQRFALSVLAEGSGTQVYSTTFVQWTARECLRRAQPLTLLARFRPRQQAATLNELFARDPFAQPTDAEGSLVDADMGAYLTWINQGRLPGADQSRFLAWFEGHSTAIAIGPSMAKGTISDAPTNLAKVMEWMA
jgi:hypothetical protein